MSVKVRSIGSEDPLVLTPDDAINAYLSGAEFEGDRVPLRAPDGTLGWADNNRANLDRLLGEGYAIANEEEVQRVEAERALREQREEREGENIQAFVEGLIPGEQVFARAVENAGFLPDDLRQVASGYADRARQRELLNPIASIAGQVGQEAALVLATGGTSLATAPGRAAARLGARQAGQAFARGAATNLALEAGQVTGDVLAGNIELASEETAARLGIATLAGGLVEGAPELWRAARGVPGSAATDDQIRSGFELWRQARGEVGLDELDEIIARNMGNVDQLDELRRSVTFDADGVPSVDQGALERAAGSFRSTFIEDDPRLIRMMADPARHVERQARQITRNYDDIAREAQVLMAHFEGEGKRQMVNRYADQALRPQQQAFANRIIKEAEALAESFGSRETVSDAFVARLWNSIDEATSSVATAGRRTGDDLVPGDFHTALDTLKREVDQFIDSKFGRNRNIGPDLRRFNNTLRGGLEDATIWGEELARRQADWNAAYRRLITRLKGPIRQALQRKGGENFSDEFLESLLNRNAAGELAFTQEWSLRGNVVEGLMARLGTLGADEMEAALRGFARDVDNFARVTDDVLDLSKSIGGKRPVRATLPDSTDARRAVLGDLADRPPPPPGTNMPEKISGLLDEAKRDAIILRETAQGGSFAETAARVAAGTIPGAGNSFAFLPSFRRGALHRVGAWLADTRLKHQDRFVKPVKELFRGLRRRGARPGRPARRPVRSRARSAERSAALTSVSAFRATVARLFEHENKPGALADNIAKSTEGLEEVAPELANGISRQVVRAHQNMMARMPSGARAEPDLFGALTRILPPPLVPDTARINFMRYVEATENPQTVVEDLANGTVTRTQVLALRDNWPVMYDTMVRTVIEQIAELDEPPPYEDRVQLSILLDQPLDPTMRGSFVASMQLSYVPEQQPPPAPTPPSAGGRGPGMAEASMSESQRLSTRGPSF